MSLSLSPGVDGNFDWIHELSDSYANAPLHRGTIADKFIIDTFKWHIRPLKFG